MKEKCPFLISGNLCCNKKNRDIKTKSKNRPDCPYNKPNKCQIYKQWLNDKKLFTESHRALHEDLNLRVLDE